MGRSALTLLVVALLASGLGVVATATISTVAVTSSSDAAKQADTAEKSGAGVLGKPEGYGSR